jgi:hypothetical protein
VCLECLGFLFDPGGMFPLFTRLHALVAGIGRRGEMRNLRNSLQRLAGRLRGDVVSRVRTTVRKWNGGKGERSFSKSSGKVSYGWSWRDFHS